MIPKKRIFYLDFIRTISMIIVVTYHFFFHFKDFSIYPLHPFLSNSKWGIIGVTMFFLLSGFSLTMINYKKIDLKVYYNKRFKSIYPLFWIVYITFFIILLFKNGGFSWNMPKLFIIFSILGIDGYMGAMGIPTAGIIGEWFLGCLLIIYLIYPLLLMIIKKKPKLFLCITTIFYFLTIMFSKGKLIPINFNFFVSLYLFTIGIYIYIYKLDFKKWQIVSFVLLSIILFSIPYSNSNLCTAISNLVGFMLFFILIHLSYYVNNKYIKYSIYKLSNDSYAIFLIQHIIILFVEPFFSNKHVSTMFAFTIYFATWIIIVFMAKIFIFIKDKVINFVAEAKKLNYES